jgi:hypothetical protein
MIISACDTRALQGFDIFGQSDRVFINAQSQLSTVIPPKRVDFTFNSGHHSMVLPSPYWDNFLSIKWIDQCGYIAVLKVSQTQLSIVVAPARVDLHLIWTGKNSVVVAATHCGHELLRQCFDLLGNIQRVLVAMTQLALHIEAERIHFAII